MTTQNTPVPKLFDEEMYRKLLAEQLRDGNGIEGIASSIDRSYEAVMTAAADSAIKMPEGVFRDVFLPLFYDGSNPTYPEATMSTWITIAKSPYHEVAVVSDEGEELFRVPPMCDVSVVEMAYGPNVPNLADIIQHAKLIGENSPGQMNQFLFQKLSEYTTHRISPEKGLEYIRRWDAIFARYGLKTILSESEGNKNNGNSSAVEIEFDFE